MEEKHWFKNKKSGIGWTPATWEGWATTGLYIASIFFLVLGLEDNEFPDITFWITLVVLTGSFIFIVYKFGEPLDWNIKK